MKSFLKKLWPFFNHHTGKKIWLLIFIINTLIIIVIILNKKIDNFSIGKTHSNITTIPYNKAGLVLGTSMYNRKGGVNMYFYHRIVAAVELFEAGKIDYIIVSGDNSKNYYNEPLLMKKELVRRGIPANRIILDFAGFRTLDSVVRCYEIFGQRDFTVISQAFQNKRAIYIGQYYHLHVSGYNAKDVNSLITLRVKIREVFARVKVFMDLYITRKSPKFLGEKINIEKQDSI